MNNVISMLGRKIVHAAAEATVDEMRAERGSIVAELRSRAVRCLSKADMAYKKGDTALSDAFEVASDEIAEVADAIEAMRFRH